MYYCATPDALVDAASLRALFRRSWSIVYFVRACPYFRACYLHRTSVHTLSHKGVYGLLMPYSYDMDLVATLRDLDTVTLSYVLSCSLVRAFCYDYTVGWFTDVRLVFKYRPKNATLLPSTRL